MSNSNSSSGTGIAGVFTIVFVVLKLTGHIDWSWLWVVSPIWITAAVIALLLVAVVAAWGTAKFVKNMTNYND